MTDVVRTHDRDRFEIYAYYCGHRPRRSHSAGFATAPTRWVDINGLSDEQAAARIATDEIDILVDLNGYTKDARTASSPFVRRRSSSTGLAFPARWDALPSLHHRGRAHHPAGQRDLLFREGSETRLLSAERPQATGRAPIVRAARRRIAGRRDVYCCLNGVQKIMSDTFRQLDDDLVAGPGERALAARRRGRHGCASLRLARARAAARRRRLIFAGKKANPEHLARYVLADLFLDTFPYGAHTTAADAIWMGVPVLTTPGKSFASRVCASLAHAAGIGELVCPTRKATSPAQSSSVGFGTTVEVQAKAGGEAKRPPAFRHASSRARPRSLYKAYGRSFSRGGFLSPTWPTWNLP